MKDECRSLMAALSVNVLTVYMFLSVFLLPGVLAQCDLLISAPKKLEALTGSCLLIPCSIKAEPEIDFLNTREPFGAWIKDTKEFLNPKYFERRMRDRRGLLFITGNLKQKNCTALISNVTTEHSNTYYFGIMRGPVSHKAECDPVDITVKDSPQSPSIEIPADLKEKTSVSITCSAPTPCPHSPPELTWNLQADSQRQTETNTDGSFTTKIQKNITLSDTHDGFTIRCSARYPVNEGPPKTAETLKTLSVSYTKQFGVIFASLKILGVLMLCAAIIIFECWFQCRFSNKPEKDSKEEVYENIVMETQTSEDMERLG
ncbi:sialic acid-binding Ig-like lectin 5 [Oryzias melastigma]|uniref:sialic acid-binding Ig-like lectin 5 n=1 Tax=Oryzias melastigma TaxID=30732 RepID=UPI000CF7D25D|nr:sialic acid-binding Ig-like lectin 5 [Oryzias melastigma]